MNSRLTIDEAKRLLPLVKSGQFLASTQGLTIDEAKRLLPLPALARRLHITAELPERDGQLGRCIWPDRHKHGDKRQSFNFYDGLTRWKCFACGASGDGPDLVSAWLGISESEGRKLFVEWAGGGDSSCPAQTSAVTVTRSSVAPASDAWGDTPEKASKRRRWPSLRMGTRSELEAVARLRGLSFAACDLASKVRWLKFGDMGGTAAWFIVSGCGRIAQARRMDGKPWSRNGAKAWTLPGSCGRVPIGLESLRADARCTAIMEGGPDLLACLHFACREDRGEIGMLAFLGASMTTPAPVLRALQGRAVRIFAHADDAGRRAAAVWAAELEAVECTVDAFDFGAFGVGDFNDLAGLSESQLEGMEVLP